MNGLKWWIPVLLGVLTFAAFGILFSLEAQFEALSGLPTFDTQNDLTAETLLQQLPHYQGEALAAYYNFAAFDFLLPLIAGSFQATLIAYLLQRRGWDRGVLRLIPLIPILSMFSDWGENTMLLSVINGASLVDAAILFKRLKLTMLALGSTATVILLVVTVIYAIINTRRRSAPVNARA